MTTLCATLSCVSPAYLTQYDVDPHSENNTRPPTPRNSRFNTPELQDILHAFWNTKPDDRPPFSRITQDIKLLRKSFGHDVFESPMLPTILDVVEPPHSPSPDMRPQKDLPNFIQATKDPPRT